MRARLVGIASSLALSGSVVAACGAVERETLATAMGGVRVPAELPDGQRAALADGIVTPAEYRAGYEEWVACLAEGGVELHNPQVDPRDGVVLYGVPMDSSGVDPIGLPESPNLNTWAGRCFDATFSWIELVFQVGDPTVQAVGEQDTADEYFNEVIPCLEKNAIDVPDPPPPIGSPEYIDLFDTFVHLANRRLCWS